MWLNGFRRTREGSPFPYHSFSAEIRTALLVRANRERPVAAWETDPVPPDLADDRVHFVWAFAIEASAEPVPFTLHVNDEALVVFENPRSGGHEEWSVVGPSGAELRFRATYRDRHGDPMGFAFLSLPAAALPRGKPLELRITSEDRDQSTWYMTYEHPVTDEIRVSQDPRVKRARGPSVQWVKLHCVHLGDDGEIRVAHDGVDVARQTLHFGRNQVEVPLPAVQAPHPVTLDVVLPDGEERTLSFVLQPVKPWTIYLVQHTHTDIGYTRPQTEILPEHLRFLDYALDFCDETDDWPDDAKFRWTCEASWPVREYLQSRPAAQIERLRQRVAEGRIELTGMMFNLSEIPDEPGLAALLEPVKRLREADLPVRVAMQNDVNGMAWCLADYLPTLGIDAFVMGQHSHRARACFERPTAFWWESPSGSRVLGWRGDHYITGNDWGIHGDDLAAFEEALFHHVEGLEAKGYPHERIAIQYSGYLTDNAPPSLLGPENIRRWNETYAWPRLRSATASEFLDWVREEHGETLPVHRAAWPDWWTDGFGSAARETAAARQTHVDLIATQGVAALARAAGEEVPPRWGARLQAAYDALLFYDEHTLGAAESISDPLCENSVVQWGEKAAYVWDAVKQTRVLREAALGSLAPLLPRREVPVLTVLNTLGFARSGLLEVYVDHQILPPKKRFRIVDADGREVAAQPGLSRSDGTYWLLLVPEVPALGYRSLRVLVEDGPRDALPRQAGTTLENEHYRLEIDRERGTLRHLVDKALDLDLVDADAEWGLLDVVYERLGDRHQLERFTLESVERTALVDVRVEPGIDGPIFRSLVVTGTAPGGSTDGGVRIEIRLFHAVKRIRIACRIQKLAITEPEGLYVAFPFALPKGEIAYEAPGGVVTPGKNQLPGSASDWHTVQNFARVRNEHAEIVVTSGEIPLWQFGGIRLGEFRYLAEVEKPHLYSWVMNNYWVTNFCASQEGEFRWQYDLTSGRAGPPAEATRFGWGARVPLVARVLPPARMARGELAFSLPTETLPAGLHVVNVRPTDDEEGLFVHLREVDGRAVRFDPRTWLGAERVRAVYEADAVGSPLAPLLDEIVVAPFGVVFLRLELATRKERPA